MEEFFFDLFLAGLAIVGFLILVYLVFSRHSLKLNLVRFWQNFALAVFFFAASKIAKIFGQIFFSEVLLLCFSFIAMTALVLAFALHYSVREEFEKNKVFK